MKKKSSLNDVSRKADVPLAGLMHYFHNPERVGVKITKKIKGAIKSVKYASPKNPQAKKAGTIALLIDKDRGPFGEFYSEIIAGMCEEAFELNWKVSIELFDSKVEQLPTVIAKKVTDGVVLISKVKEAFVKTLIRKKVPYCVVDHQLAVLDHNYVIPNWYQGARRAAWYLIKNGHRRIAMIHSSPELGNVSLDRIKGFNEMLDENHIELPDGYLVDGAFDPQKSYEVTQKLLKLHPRPSAIFYATDVMAIGGYRAIYDAGLKIPQDISVVGFDNINFPYYMDPLDPSLTTVDGNKRTMGIKAIDMIHQLITKEDTCTKVLMPMKLIERKSVRTLRK